MIVSFNLASLKSTRFYECALRFAFGGLITLAAGFIAKKYGPSVGGLFLAFPAIFPATITLIEKHEQQRKEQAGFNGTSRGRSAASLEAAGTALGSLALLLFAFIVWQTLPIHSPWLILPLATIAWITLATLAWFLRKKLHRRPSPQSPSPVI